MTGNEKSPGQGALSVENGVSTEYDPAPENDKKSQPYGQNAETYFEFGWIPFPLPAGKKFPPPSGRTGRPSIGNEPNGSQIAQEARKNAGANIGTRMPVGVLGIDVDAYDGKPGAETLADLYARLGALPDAPVSTSREDGVSGIRFFRVPDGVEFVTKLPGIEFIQPHHRYAVVEPSAHPETGRSYRWTSGGVPKVSDLPELPAEWLDHLRADSETGRTDQRNVHLEDAVAFVRALPKGEPCMVIQRHLATALEALEGREISRHDTAMSGVMSIMNSANAGHTGGARALKTLGDAFEVATAGEHRPEEWNRLLIGAVGRVEPIDADDRACCDQWHDGYALFGMTPPGESTEEPEETPASSYAGPYREDVLHEARRMYVARKARELVDDQVARETGHAIDWESRAINGAAWLTTEETEPKPLWGTADTPLWLSGESLLIVGPPSVGKSTLAHAALWGALGLAPDVLGFPIESMTDGGVLYLAMDRPRQIQRAMARFLLANPDRREEIETITRERLTIWSGPLPGDITTDKRLLIAMAERFGRTRIVVDSIKDVLPNASDEARAGGYNIARQEALAEGLEWIELHHNRKAGAENKEPNSLDDVYGSRWITAGAGSVLSLFGQPGDIVLRLSHIKPLREPMLPAWVQVDRRSGAMSIHEETTPEDVLRAAGLAGITAEDAARALYGTTKSPTKSQVQNARNKINRLVDANRAQKVETEDGPLRYRMLDDPFKEM